MIRKQESYSVSFYLLNSELISRFESVQKKNILCFSFNHTTTRRAKVQRFLAVLLNCCMTTETSPSG